MVWGPAGSRRRVYFPSVPVMVLRPMAGIATDTLLSWPPSDARVTVPVTVPVSCAAATAGMARATRTARDVARRASGRVWRGADELRRIPGFLLRGRVGRGSADRRTAGFRGYDIVGEVQQYTGL
jgi:hypothetical protein